ncbi:MAG: hypothetical protein JXR60_10885 [Bacteroidales bacterium]|nr:hypothetical protein [Bacteroidales bacterium]
MKKYIILILAVALLIPSVSNAQRWKRYRYEVMAGLGTVNLFSDYGGGAGDARHNTLDFDIQGTRPALLVGGRYKLKELLSVKANVVFAFANASDKYTSNVPRSNRMGTSNTFMIEPSVQFEYSLIKEMYGRRYTFSNIRRFNITHVNTYIFVGVGGLLYFPSKTIEIDNDINKSHGVFTAAFPIGIGFKYAINRVYTFGVELGNRFTTSDYLDGHSDKYSTANDSYLFLLFTVSKRLRTSRKGLPRF